LILIDNSLFALSTAFPCFRKSLLSLILKFQ
jgi:hypothetical protein